MPPLRLLLVDDEPLARERLRALLATEDDVEIVGECGSGPEAIAAITQQAPDVVFLDMQMPGCDGLEVLARLPATARPAVVFVTAHDRFAVDAFGVQAVDYLLKPYDRERFRMALNRAREQVRVRRTEGLGHQLQSLLAGAAATPARPPDRLAVKADGRVVLVRPEDIVWVEAADNYVILHLRDDRLMLRETLSSIEARLGTAHFARVNRSALVHLDQVKELQPTFHGDYVVILRSGVKLPLSRSWRGQLAALLRGL